MYNSKISCKEIRELYMQAYDDNKEAVDARLQGCADR